VTPRRTVSADPPRARGGRPPSVESILGEREEPRGANGDEVAAASRPAGASFYLPWWKVWLPIPLLLLLLDVAFPLYFWRIPKLSGSSDDYTYQFLSDLRDMEANPPHGVRVLAFGSSVASAFDPYQIDGLLEQTLPGAVEVRRVIQPGMKPSDYRLLWASQLERIDPAVVVPVFNLVDFLNPSFERELKPAIRYVLPPWETLLARYEYIPRVSEKLEMALASASNLYRYRKPIRSSIRDHAKWVRSWWRAAAPGRPYGVFGDGCTESRFGIPVTGRIEYLVQAAWIDQRGRARLAFDYDGRELARVEHTDAGWKSVEIPLPANATGLLHGRVESTWSPRVAGVDDDIRLLGVCLKDGPGATAAARGNAPLRYPPVESSDTKPFLPMGAARGPEYVERWNALLNADTEFGKRYRLYRDGKLERARQEFQAAAEVVELREMVREIAAKGRRVVMINTPENPILAGVVDTPFYADYLAFFEAVAAADPRITFVDLHDRVAAEDLNDWHHLNFIGQLRIGTTVAGALEPVVAEALRERTGTR
jgi:hypothetical protein